MLGYIDKIRKISKKILKDKRVDLIIGFKKGTMPMINEPCFINKEEDVNQIIWDANCGINLSNYLTDRKEKIAIIAKGCDSRNIVNHIIENKIKREQLFIIGVPCKGMIDKNKISSIFNEEILEVQEEEDKLIIKGKNNKKTIKKQDFYQKNCQICTQHNPVIYDELVADLIKEKNNVDKYKEVNDIEAMSSNEKWNFFEDLLSNCIRCYACRNVCPLCFCPTCFVDESSPQWVGKSNDSIDIKTFHFLRAYHCAGRCTDCGSCVRACPMNIDVRLLTKKLEKDSYEKFGWQAGLSIKERPPLDTFKPDDPNEFIK